MWNINGAHIQVACIRNSQVICKKEDSTWLGKNENVATKLIGYSTECFNMIVERAHYCSSCKTLRTRNKCYNHQIQEEEASFNQHSLTVNPTLADGGSVFG